MSEAAAAGVAGMSSGVPGDFRSEQPRSFASTTPTSLDAWAYAVLGPLIN